MDATHPGPRRKLAGELKIAQASWDWRAVWPIQDSDPDPHNSQPLALKLDHQALGMSREEAVKVTHPTMNRWGK